MRNPALGTPAMRALALRTLPSLIALLLLAACGKPDPPPTERPPEPQADQNPQKQ